MVSKKKKKKKKVFTEIETDFSAKIENSNIFSAQRKDIVFVGLVFGPAFKLWALKKRTFGYFLGVLGGQLILNRKRGQILLKEDVW